MSIKSIDWVSMTRDGGSVIRYHTCRTIGSQTVAEHSFGVAMLIIWLTEGNCSVDLMKAALYHDMAEQHTGDMPATIKKAEDVVKELFDRLEGNFDTQYDLVIDLSFEEKNILKWADTLELLLYCVEEYELGNKNVKKVFNRGYSHTFEYSIHAKADMLRKALKERINNEESGG